MHNIEHYFSLREKAAYEGKWFCNIKYGVEKISPFRAFSEVRISSVPGKFEENNSSLCNAQVSYTFQYQMWNSYHLFKKDSFKEKFKEGEMFPSCWKK